MFETEAHASGCLRLSNLDPVVYIAPVSIAVTLHAVCRFNTSMGGGDKRRGVQTEGRDTATKCRSTCAIRSTEEEASAGIMLARLFSPRNCKLSATCSQTRRWCVAPPIFSSLCCGFEPDFLGQTMSENAQATMALEQDYEGAMEELRTAKQSWQVLRLDRNGFPAC